MASQAKEQDQQNGILGDPQVVNEQKELRKVLGQIFDESDLKDDEDRKDLFVWQNDIAIAHSEKMVGKLGLKKTKDDLLHMAQDMNTALWYGDFYSPNDGYPLAAETDQRRRMYYMRDNWNSVLRVEMSKSLL